jgi:flagellar protein FliS
MSINAYTASAVQSADPVTLTTMLYDGALRAIRKADRLFQENNRPAFFEEVNRAYLIVGELLATLDLEQGDLPRQLSGIYTYCMRCLIEATTQGTGRLQEAEKHIARIADAWKQATAGLRVTAPAAPDRMVA